MKNRRFSTNFSVYFENGIDTAIVTTEDEYELVRDLSNGAIFNDLERPVT